MPDEVPVRVAQVIRLFIASSQRSFSGVAWNFEGVCAEIKAGVAKVLQTRRASGYAPPENEFCFHMM